MSVRYKMAAMFCLLAMVLLMAAVAGVNTSSAEPLATSVTLEGYKITFVVATYNADGTSTWTYTVEKVVGDAKGLSHWVIGLCPTFQQSQISDVKVDGSTWTKWSFGDDTGPNGTQVTSGLKYDETSDLYDDLPLGTSHTFSFTLDKWYGITDRDVGVKPGETGLKGGPIDGPDCTCGGSYTVLGAVKVGDAAGAALEGVNVNLSGTTWAGVSVNVDTTTDDQGNFLFSNVLPGQYTLTETDPGTYYSVGDTDGLNDNQIGVNLVCSETGGSSSDNEFYDESPTAVTLASFGAVAAGSGAPLAVPLALAGVTLIAVGGLRMRRRHV